MKAAESAFYAPLQKKKEAREDTMEGIEEHHVSELVEQNKQKVKKNLK